MPGFWRIRNSIHHFRILVLTGIMGCAFFPACESATQQNPIVVTPNDRMPASESLPKVAKSKPKTKFKSKSKGQKKPKQSKLISHVKPHQPLPKIFTPKAIARVPASKTKIEEKVETPQSLPEVTAVNSNEYQTHSDLELGTDFQYLRIEGKQHSNSSRATFVTSLSPGLILSWKQHWSESFRTSLNLGLKHFKFKPSSQRTMIDGSQTLSQFGAKLEWDLKANTHLDLNLSVKDEIFYRVPSANTLEIDSIAIPRLGTVLTYDFYQHQNFTFFTSPAVRILLPTKTDDHDVHTGFGYSLSLGISQKLKNDTGIKNIKGEMTWEEQLQNTAILNRREKYLGIRFSISWGGLR